MSPENIYHTVEIIKQTTYYSIDEVCRVSAVDESWVRELLDYEIIKFEDNNEDNNEDKHEQFSDTQLDIVRKAHRLQRDLELNTAGVALALQLLETIEEQKQELNFLRYRIRSAE